MSKKKLLLLAPALLVLTACGGTSEPEITGEEQYVAIVRADGGPMAETATDEQLLRLGYAACREFEQGVEPKEIYDDLATFEESKVFLASTLAAAKVFLCG